MGPGRRRADPQAPLTAQAAPLAAYALAVIATAAVLFVAFLGLAGSLRRGDKQLQRTERDRRLAAIARSRVPLLVRDRLDRALADAVAALSLGDDPALVAADLDVTTSGGALLPHRARARYAAAVGLLREAGGEAWELEVAKGEAAGLLWEVRWDVSRGEAT